MPTDSGVADQGAPADSGAASEQMHCSRNELTALAIKVARARGFSYGVAEDLGRATAWLAASGHDGLGAVLATRPAPGIDVDWQVDVAHAAGGSTGSHGPAIIDLVAINTHQDAMPQQVTFSGFDSPLLLVGLCAIAAQSHTVEFDCASGAGDSLVVNPTGTKCSGSGDWRGDITVRCRPAESTGRPQKVDGDIVINKKRWEQAALVAAETYVPATDASRMSGAGAGLTDND